jgi:hypothetical protein
VRESVVLVHGIWMTGLACVPLRARLRAAGFEVRLFSYPSLALTPAQSAARLRQGLRHVEGDVVHFSERALARSILGRSTERGLLGDVPDWPAGRDLGVVAGTLPLGFGRALCDLPEPHDGTVAAAETEVDGATDRWLVPVSHTGLLFSSVVAQGVARFLRSGRFPVPEPAART